jgi:hypothetical protein
MNIINKEPILVDFGNADQDGAIRLITNGAIADVERLGIILIEGKKIWLTDNDVEMIGTLSFRKNIWVVIPDENGFKKVLK